MEEGNKDDRSNRAGAGDYRWPKLGAGRFL